MASKQFAIPSIEQRKSQINFFNFMEKERRDSKEFSFPDDNLLHRRRQSNDVHSATQSEDDESVSFEVSVHFRNLFPLNPEKCENPISSPKVSPRLLLHECLFNFPLPLYSSPTW